ncbi:MAG: YcaO-like family protein [Bdellovibrionaceae bacterium]|nr:YcaO-like family protein [Pseudobdellovibrionaceae bacterium]
MARRINNFLKSPKLKIAFARTACGDGWHSGVVFDDLSVSGFATGKEREATIRVAIFEAIERFIFRNYSSSKDASCSGWAAHTNLLLARKNAFNELVERDGMLVTWLTKRSPKQLYNAGLDFSTLGYDAHIFTVSSGARCCVLGAVVKSKDHDKKIFLSAGGSSETDSINKLYWDIQRGIDFLNTGKYMDLNKEMYLHWEKFCEFVDNDIGWLFKDGPGLSYPQLNAEYDDYEVPLWDGTTAWVSRARCDYLQEVFWGLPTAKNINIHRFMDLGVHDISSLNMELHPIL